MPPDLRIVAVHATVIDMGRANLVVASIDTDGRVSGCGETILRRHDQTVRSSITELGATIVGRDPGEIEAIAEQLYRDSFWVGGPLAAAARSAIDIALWDIKGKCLGVPVYELLGGPTRPEVPLYCHCPSGPTPEAFAARLRDLQGAGFVGAKTTLPLYYGGGQDAPSSSYSGTRGSIDPRLREAEYLPTSAIDRIAAFLDAGRSAVGDDFELMVDCHGRLNPTTALLLGRELAPFRLMFLEEPIPPESAVELARLRERSPIPIAAGERLSSIYEVTPFLEAGAVDYLQCDPVTCGGITGLKKIAALAEAHYVPLAPHNPNGPIATLACVHVLASIPNASVLETVGSVDDTQRFGEIVNPWPAERRGTFALPATAGLGMSLSADAARRFPPGTYGGTR